MLKLSDKVRAITSSIASEDSRENFNLESTVQELSLYDLQIDVGSPGIVISKIFESDRLVPGVILTEQGQFAGMMSRRRFYEYISRPFGRELFLPRSIKSMYRFARAEVLVVSKETLIVDAARISLERSPELLYEPIVVQLSPEIYRLADVHNLLVAQSQIHQLATELIRKQTQSHLIQTEKLASLGQMVAEVAHEIRNPVGYILGNSKFLSSYYEDIIKLLSAYETENTQKSDDEIELVKSSIDWEFLQEDLPEVIQGVKISAERLDALVRSLRNFSHMDESKPKAANIHQCIDGSLLILKNNLKQGAVEVIKNYGKIPLVSCYSGQLSQVFMNLLSNAIDALEEIPKEENRSSTICITTEVRSKEYIAIRIADNGAGIPKEAQNKIFENFFTTKPVGKGTGMGLAITYQIITEKHQGQLKFHSAPGMGTEFEILLPISKNS
ncbi:MAG: ATP-binding protein [Cyanobacteriota bacterium]|nr:ATP-binding protein [Cyanobacteriota bacterium]